MYVSRKAWACARLGLSDPTEPQARNFYSHLQVSLHRVEESDEQILKSLEIDPLNPFTRMFRAIQLGL